MAARVVVACMRCMRRVVVSTLVVRRVRVVALCGAADFWLPARPPALACRVCCSCAPRWPAPLPIVPRVPSDWGVVFASRSSCTTGSCALDCCPSRSIVELLQSRLPGLMVLRRLPAFSFAKDLDQRGSTFFFKIALHLANLYHLLTAGL